MRVCRQVPIIQRLDDQGIARHRIECCYSHIGEPQLVFRGLRVEQMRAQQVGFISSSKPPHGNKVARGIVQQICPLNERVPVDAINMVKIYLEA